MRRLIFRIVIFIIFFGILINVLLFIIGSKKSVSEVVKLKHHNLENFSSPRIILVGGSGIYYGIDSKKIVEDLNIPVVNMGLFIGCGLNYMLSEIKPYLKEDDVIVIVPEYGSYKRLHGNKRFINYFFFYPQSILYLNSIKQYLNLFSNYPSYIKRNFGKIPSNIFRKKGLKRNEYDYCNEYGDCTGHLDFDHKNDTMLSLTNQLERKARITYPDLEEIIVLINDFNKYTMTLNCKVVFSYPPLPNDVFSLNKEEYEYIISRLESDLEIPIINNQSEYLYPIDYFYDSINHLNNHGRVIRTKSLINNLVSAGVVQ